MARKAKRVICLAISLFLCSCNILVAKAEALPEVLSGSTTLADNIMSYYALSGSAIANTDWINTLYNSYGSSFGTVEELASQGYLVLNDAGMWEPTQQLGQMIEQAPAYTSLGLNEMFNVSAEEVAAGGGLAVASGGSILAGSLGGVASTGALTLFGGVTAAYWGGIALGTLIAHAVGLYGKPISTGVTISSASQLQYVPNGSFVYSREGPNNGVNNNREFYIDYFDPASNDIVGVGQYFSGSNTYQYLLVNASNNAVKFYEVDSYGNVSEHNLTYKGAYYQAQSYHGYSDNLTLVGSNSVSGIVDNVINNRVERRQVYSPDVIGPEGNQEGNYDSDSGKYQVPNMLPQVDPGVQAGKPLTLQDWLNFANGVKNNNNNSSPSSNKTLFENIIDSITIAMPENVPNPSPNPTPDPNPYPDPHPNPDPDNVPVPDYEDPEQETQPDYDSETETVPDPENGKPWVTPNLLDKFPFCIPKDLMNMAKNFNSGTRQAPEIEWRFNPPNTPIDFTFHLDLEDFEAVAVLLRTLELALFVVGLAFATRYLIGAS